MVSIIWFSSIITRLYYSKEHVTGKKTKTGKRNRIESRKKTNYIFSDDFKKSGKQIHLKKGNIFKKWNTEMFSQRKREILSHPMQKNNSKSLSASKT